MTPHLVGRYLHLQVERANSSSTNVGEKKASFGPVQTALPCR